MKRHTPRVLICVLALVLGGGQLAAAANPARDAGGNLRWLTATDGTRPDAGSDRHSRLVRPGADGRLVYAKGEAGETIPDFSTCGYMGGGVPLPVIPIRVTLQPQPGGGDDRPRIQAAIDSVAQRAPDERGFRGAVLLARGQYRVNGTLKISAGGVVLRGEGPGEDGTVLTATLAQRHTVIEVGGTGDLQREESSRQRVIDAHVPVGARTFRVADASGFRVGDRVIVHRPSTAEWIAALGMDRLTATTTKPGIKNWTPGGFDLHHDRTVVAIEGNALTVNAPIFQALEQRFGGGSVVRYRDPNRIEHAGVENLRIVSLFDRSKVKAIPGVTPAQAIRQFEDEDHAWHGVVLDRIRNGWVSRVTVVNAGYSAVHCQTRALFTTVQDCAMIDPVSQHTGGRKYCFGANGQFGLFLRCHARNGRHDFVLGNRLAGPNVFLDCIAEEASASSEPHHRYGTGCLWDNVRLYGGGELQAVNRGDSGSGHGWAGANNVFWNCVAPAILVMKPPTAQNWAIGWIGESEHIPPDVAARHAERLRRMGAHGGESIPHEGRPILGDGYIESPTAPVAPRSLYLRQLEDRMGPEALRAVLVPSSVSGRPPAAPRMPLARKGTLLLQDDFQRHAIYTKERLPVADGWQVRVAHGKWQRTAEGVASSWESGHNPVLVYEGTFGDVIIEVDFRYRREPGKWAACRVSASNGTLDPRAYAVSVWANVDFDSRARGLVLENDQWSGPITQVNRSRAELLPDTWYTVRLELVGSDAFAECHGFTVKGRHEKFGIPKTSIWLGTGQSRHELRNLRVYSARPMPTS